MTHAIRVQCKSCGKFVQKNNEYTIISKRTRGLYGTSFSFNLCSECREKRLGDLEND